MTHFYPTSPQSSTRTATFSWAQNYFPSSSGPSSKTTPHHRKDTASNCWKRPSRNAEKNHGSRTGPVFPFPMFYKTSRPQSTAETKCAWTTRPTTLPVPVRRLLLPIHRKSCRKWAQHGRRHSGRVSANCWCIEAVIQWTRNWGVGRHPLCTVCPLTVWAAPWLIRSCGSQIATIPILWIKFRQQRK